ncbi:MAG: glutaredoxin 3 [Xanthobacteraceae bacterium]
MMQRATIYTARFCPYCEAAKSLLKSERIPFDEVDISGNWEARDEMINRSNGQTTIPQIFIGDRRIGGLNDLKALQNTGALGKQTEFFS